MVLFCTHKRAAFVTKSSFVDRLEVFQFKIVEMMDEVGSFLSCRCLNSRPPETFSVTRPPKGGCYNPLLDFLYIKRSILLCLLPMYSLLIPKKYHPRSYDVLWCNNVSAPSKFWKYSQSLTIYTICRIGQSRFLAKNRRNMRFSRDYLSNK